MYQVCKSFSFDAAHILRGYDGNCARLHGHRWEVAVCVEGSELDGIGMLVDFRFIKEAAQRATANYDHNMLNEISPYDEINPSAENIARTIYLAIRAELATSAPHAHLAYVQVAESPTSWAKYWE
jgi:6-pyruvoyltetrahydropterin/6-carboxytetrahydropterin synthase